MLLRAAGVGCGHCGAHPALDLIACDSPQQSPRGRCAKFELVKVTAGEHAVATCHERRHETQLHARVLPGQTQRCRALPVRHKHLDHLSNVDAVVGTGGVVAVGPAVAVVAHEQRSLGERPARPQYARRLARGRAVAIARARERLGQPAEVLRMKAGELGGACGDGDRRAGGVCAGERVEEQRAAPDGAAGRGEGGGRRDGRAISGAGSRAAGGACCVACKLLNRIEHQLVYVGAARHARVQRASEPRAERAVRCAEVRVVGGEVGKKG